MNRPLIQCPACGGIGLILEAPSPFTTQSEAAVGDCEECNAKGWRPMTDEEWSDWSADRYSDMCEGEPPLTAQERHERDWKQKQELKR